MTGDMSQALSTISDEQYDHALQRFTNTNASRAAESHLQACNSVIISENPILKNNHSSNDKSPPIPDSVVTPGVINNAENASIASKNSVDLEHRTKALKSKPSVVPWRPRSTRLLAKKDYIVSRMAPSLSLYV
jgi:hypothetical protein